VVKSGESLGWGSPLFLLRLNITAIHKIYQGNIIEIHKNILYDLVVAMDDPMQKG
jgi:hypothetical protein